MSRYNDSLLQTSIILPSYNRAGTLRITLQSLARQTMPLNSYEVIVVDDGSSDDTLQTKKDFETPYDLYLLCQNNMGPGAARNRGARNSHGTLLIFLDADMVADSTLIEAFWKRFQASPQVIQVGRQLPFLTAYSSRFERIYNYVCVSDFGPKNMDARFYHLQSGNFALSQDIFWSLGGFDETLIMTEDTELGYRACQQGINIQYNQHAVGYHNHSKTFKQLCSQAVASSWWTAHMMAKHSDMCGQIPYYRTAEPIQPNKDTPELICQKRLRQLLASPYVLRSMEIIVGGLERLPCPPRILRFFYFRILAAHAFNGFQAGLEHINNNQHGFV